MARMVHMPEQEQPEKPAFDDQSDGHPPPQGAAGNGSAKVWTFAAICAVCAVFATGYILRFTKNGASGAPTAPAASASDLQAVLAKPHVFFAESGGSPLIDYPLAIAALSAPDGAHLQAGFTCQRVYVAAGEGLCLTLGHQSSAAKAFIFDSDFKVIHALSPVGIPSRARISSDGRYGSMTYFVTGDSYAVGSQFSTRTTIVDMHTGNVVANLEDFTVHRDGQEFHLADFNFWGVTFAQDSNHFYATLASGGKTYLVAGDVAGREMHTLGVENVECPSLSPDNQRIVFKKRIADGPPTVWRLTVLDLKTMRETPLTETRSVDDQAEWLDNNHVLYTPTTQKPATWSVPADGSGQPQLFAAGVVSPSVVH